MAMTVPITGYRRGGLVKRQRPPRMRKPKMPKPPKMGQQRPQDQNQDQDRNAQAQPASPVARDPDNLSPITPDMYAPPNPAAPEGGGGDQDADTGYRRGGYVRGYQDGGAVSNDPAFADMVDVTSRLGRNFDPSNFRRSENIKDLTRMSGPEKFADRLVGRFEGSTRRDQSGTPLARQLGEGRSGSIEVRGYQGGGPIVAGPGQITAGPALPQAPPPAAGAAVPPAPAVGAPARPPGRRAKLNTGYATGFARGGVVRGSPDDDDDDGGGPDTDSDESDTDREPKIKLPPYRRGGLVRGYQGGGEVNYDPHLLRNQLSWGPGQGPVTEAQLDYLDSLGAGPGGAAGSDLGTDDYAAGGLVRGYQDGGDVDDDFNKRLKQRGTIEDPNLASQETTKAQQRLQQATEEANAAADPNISSREFLRRYPADRGTSLEPGGETEPAMQPSTWKMPDQPTTTTGTGYEQQPYMPKMTREQTISLADPGRYIDDWDNGGHWLRGRLIPYGTDIRGIIEENDGDEELRQKYGHLLPGLLREQQAARNANLERQLNDIYGGGQQPVTRTTVTNTQRTGGYPYARGGYVRGYADGGDVAGGQQDDYQPVPYTGPVDTSFQSSAPPSDAEVVRDVLDHLHRKYSAADSGLGRGAPTGPAVPAYRPSEPATSENLPEAGLGEMLQGHGAMHPQDAGDVMAKTSADNPRISRNDLVEKAIANLAREGPGYDAAAALMQTMRKTYDGHRAIARAALTSGDHDGAAQALTAGDDHLPHGHNLTVTPTADRNFDFAVESKDGRVTHYPMTPNQVQQYTEGLAGQFDHAVVNGPHQNLDTLTRVGTAAAVNPAYAAESGQPQTAGTSSDQAARAQMRNAGGSMDQAIQQFREYRGRAPDRYEMRELAEIQQANARQQADQRRQGTGIYAPPSVVPAAGSIEDRRVQAGLPAFVPSEKELDYIAGRADTARLRDVLTKEYGLTPEKAQDYINAHNSFFAPFGSPRLAPPISRQEQENMAARAAGIDEYKRLVAEAQPRNVYPVINDPRIAPQLEWGTASAWKEAGAQGAVTRPDAKGGGGTASPSTSYDRSGSESRTPHFGPGMPSQYKPNEAGEAAEANRLAAARLRLEQYGPAPWERPGWHNDISRPLDPSVFQPTGARGPYAQTQSSRSDATGTALLDNDRKQLSDWAKLLQTDPENAERVKPTPDQMRRMGRNPDGTIATAPSGGNAQAAVGGAPPAAVQALRNDPRLSAEFDAKYGRGAAAQVLGQ